MCRLIMIAGTYIYTKNYSDSDFIIHVFLFRSKFCFYTNKIQINLVASENFEIYTKFVKVIYFHFFDKVGVYYMLIEKL